MKTLVKKLKTPSNIEIWFVRHELPLLALEWSVTGGAASDTKLGLSSMMISLLDEGAGEYPMEQFQELLEDKAIELHFNADRETVGGSLKTLSEHADEAFRLLSLAVNKPRFDDEAIARVKEQTASSLKRASTHPNSVAEEAFWGVGFKGHGYANPRSGTLASIADFSKADFNDARLANFRRDSLKIAAVGMIDEQALIDHVEAVFGSWATKSSIILPEAIKFTAKGTETRQLAIPQTILQFGVTGPQRRDADFMASFVMNHMLGGGTFTARLMKEVREARGLTYGVYTHLYPLSNAGLLMGGLSVKNEKAGEAMQVISDEFRKMALGVTGEELTQAKAYLTGSYALRFDNSNSIAANLLRLMRDGYAPSYLKERNSEIEAVSVEAVKAAGESYLKPENFLIVAVGEPLGL
jgi:zinc protease